MGLADSVMSVQKHIGDLREGDAFGRRAVIPNPSRLTQAALAHCRERAAVSTNGGALELTFSCADDCLDFLDAGFADFEGAHGMVFRNLRTEMSLYSADVSEFRSKVIALGVDYPSMDLKLTRHSLIVDQRRCQQSVPFVRDQRPQLLKRLCASGFCGPCELPAKGSWRDLQKLRRTTRLEHPLATIELEPGRFLVFGPHVAVEAAKASLMVALPEIADHSSEEIPFGVDGGLAALQGFAGETYAFLQAGNPEVNFKLDVERRRLHVDGSRAIVQSAVRAVEAALVATGGVELLRCAACEGPAKALVQMLLCGCRLCDACFLLACEERKPCICGGPILPADVAESLSERGVPILQSVYRSYLEEQCAPKEKVRTCLGCTWPFLASGNMIRCCRCGLMCFTDAESFVDVQFRHADLGSSEWERLSEVCDIQHLGQDWLRLSGNASSEAASLCEAWTEVVTKVVETPARMERFIIRHLKAIGFSAKFEVRFEAKACRVEILGPQARVQTAHQWLLSYLRSLLRDTLALTSGQGYRIRSRLHKEFKNIEDEEDVCLDISADKSEIYVAGFVDGVLAALAKLKPLVELHVVSVELPCVGNREDISWRFVKPILEEIEARDEFAGVVQPSSRPGCLYLQGVESVVNEVEVILRERLRLFEGFVVPIDRKSKGVVIGKKGANIKRWQEARVFVAVGNDEDDNVYIGGDTEGIGRVHDDIKEMVGVHGGEDARRAQTRASEPPPGKRDEWGRGLKMHCRFFEKGRCEQGERCKFTHDMTQSAGPEGATDEAVQERGSAVLMKTPCRFFLAGGCRDGEGCKFAHETSRAHRHVRMAGESRENGYSSSRSLEGTLCRFFQASRCRNGDDCPFTHARI